MVRRSLLNRKAMLNSNTMMTIGVPILQWRVYPLAIIPPYYSNLLSARLLNIWQVSPATSRCRSGQTRSLCLSPGKSGPAVSSLLTVLSTVKYTLNITHKGEVNYENPKRTHPEAHLFCR